MYLKHPGEKEKSVSLTLLIISFIILIGMGILQAFNVVQSIGPFMEIFITTVTLYFGRRIPFDKLLTNKK